MNNKSVLSFIFLEKYLVTNLSRFSLYKYQRVMFLFLCFISLAASQICCSLTNVCTETTSCSDYYLSATKNCTTNFCPGMISVEYWSDADCGGSLLSVRSYVLGNTTCWSWKENSYGIVSANCPDETITLLEYDYYECNGTGTEIDVIIGECHNGIRYIDCGTSGTNIEEHCPRYFDNSDCSDDMIISDDSILVDSFCVETDTGSMKLDCSSSGALQFYANSSNCSGTGEMIPLSSDECANSTEYGTNFSYIPSQLCAVECRHNYCLSYFVQTEGIECNFSTHYTSISQRLNSCTDIEYLQVQFKSIYPQTALQTAYDDSGCSVFPTYGRTYGTCYNQTNNDLEYQAVATKCARSVTLAPISAYPVPPTPTPTPTPVETLSVWTIFAIVLATAAVIGLFVVALCRIQRNRMINYGF
jgi:hypothetical protein